jgi:ligand-binding sensor domain-containing protein
MWFATANGVSRYDGYKFENFDLQSGLVDNEVFEIYEDYKHRIWFIPMSGKLSYYEDGKVVNYKYNSKIKDHLPLSRGPIKCSFYVDSLDYVYLSLKQFGLIRISPEGVCKRYDKENTNLSLYVEELSGNKILISNPNNPYSTYVTFHGLFQDFKIILKDFKKFGSYIPHHTFFISTPDSSVICSFFGMIFKVKNGKIISRRNYNEEIIWMSIDENNNLWVGMQEGGVQCFENYDFVKSPQKILLPNIQVSSVLKDREGAYWFSSLNDGVFYCSDINFVTYTKENGLVDNRIKAVAANREGVFVSYEFGFVDQLKKNGIVHFLSSNSHLKNSFVRRICIDSIGDRIWLCAIDNLYWIKDNKVYELGRIQNFNSVHPRGIVKSRSGDYWIGTTRGLVRYNGDNVVYESFINNYFNGLIYDLVEDNDGVIWFCTMTGLWKYLNGIFYYLGSDNPILAQTCISLIQNPIDSSLWIGTNGAGIIVKNKREVYQITSADGLISNSVQQLCYANRNVWVATRQGLSRVLVRNGKFLIQNFTYANGLPTNEVTSVCELDGKVYVGTSKGLTVFDKEKIAADKMPPRVIISNFLVNNLLIDLSLKKIDLMHDQNSLSFDFVGFVYRNEGNVQYKYRVVGVDTNWVRTKTPNCLYSGLSNGDYTFEVKAQSASGIWSSMPASITFTIHPPFWKQIWFLLIGALLFSLIIFLVFKVRVSSIKRRNDMLQNINLYKQQSLRQQMNPHFIFNTLNSIQLYILEKDSINSHKYLTKFARLMRMTLENSLFSTIPLRDEIEALKLYLDLEKLRLEERFDYSIEFSAGESILNYRIPTLLIQPFVENAIWHGISLKQDQQGWVKITLLDNDNTLTCIIEDNGVGRKQADEIRQKRNKEHKSRGSHITQQRIELLSMMYKERFSIYYDDLFDSQGISSGTKVTIVIPKEVNANV